MKTDFEKLSIKGKVGQLKKDLEDLVELAASDPMDWLRKQDDPIIQEWEGTNKDWDGHTGNEPHDD